MLTFFREACLRRQVKNKFPDEVPAEAYASPKLTPLELLVWIKYMDLMHRLGVKDIPCDYVV